MRTNFAGTPDWSNVVAKDFICDRCSRVGTALIMPSGGHTGYWDYSEKGDKMKPTEQIICDECEKKT